MASQPKSLRQDPAVAAPGGETRPGRMMGAGGIAVPQLFGEPLEEHRWELFAQNVARGMGVGESYSAVGYKAVSADVAQSCGSRLLGDARIQARVAAIKAASASAVVEVSIADRNARLREYDRRWRALKAVISARAQLYSDVEGKQHGADTGLLVRRVKTVGSGRKQGIVSEYLLDTGLTKAMAELEKQAAIEKGEWTERSEVTWNGDPSQLSEKQLEVLMNWLANLGGVDVVSVAAEAVKLLPEPE